MRILITGSEGVLGSVLRKKLIEKGHDVYGCDLMHTDDPKYMRADISERRQIARVFDVFNPELVYNFAAEFGRNNGQDYYEQLFKTNMTGTQNVIEECIKHRATLAHASSSEAYGLSEQYTNGSLDEGLLDKFPPSFHNLYALTKYANERQIHTAARNDNLNAVVFRFFNVYGPPEMYSPYRSVVCQLAYKILTNKPLTVTKDGYRSHLWIGDWANAVASLPESAGHFGLNKYWEGSAETPRAPTFNIGGDDYTSIEELYNLLVNIIKPPVRPNVTFVSTEENNTATKRPNNNLSKFWLGFKSEMHLRDGLEETVRFLRSVHGL
jgi:dTDP-glucose 4,6-dehydratase